MSALTPFDPVLGLLAIRPQHGYELMQTFRAADGLGTLWKLSTSQLYAMLRRMERAGLIHGTQIETPEGPPRTEFTLSAAGNARLEAWFQDPSPSTSIRRIRLEFLSKIYLAKALKRPTDEIFLAQLQMCGQKLVELQSARGQLDDDCFQAISLDFAIGQLAAVVDWLYSARDRLV